MSLNGLDTAKVNIAHERAVAESGGWFLLHYISRDEVDVLQTGGGGFTEVKEAVAKYEEKSPLYGLLVYRRKKVLLKYVPQGTSRLLQARLSVHVQSAIEKFPHDALISVETAPEINETTLSSSVTSPKPSNASISNESLKTRRRLTEIAEDVGETPLQSPGAPAIDSLSQSAEKELDISRRPSVATTVESELNRENSVERPSRRGRLETHSTLSSFAGKETVISGQSYSPSKESRDIGDRKFEVSTLASSEALAHLYKPKIKVVPRPSLENRHSGSFIRPVATLPASIRLGQRETDTMRRPHTQQVHSKPFFAIPNVYPNGTAASVYNSPTFDRPISRAGSAATVPANPRHSEQPDTPPPEKQRLMKALQKRKKNQMAKANAETNRASIVPGGNQYPKRENTHEVSEVVTNEAIDQKSPRKTRGNADSSSDRPSSQSHVNPQAMVADLKVEPVSSATSSELKEPSLPQPRDTTANHETEATREATDDPFQSEETPSHSLQNNLKLSPKARNSQSPPPEQDNTLTEDAHEAREPPCEPDLLQKEPQDIPLPPENDQERAAIGFSDVGKAIDDDPAPEVKSSPKQNLEPVLEQQDDLDPITVSIQHASESTLDRKQKPPPITPTRPEDVSRAPSLSDESLLEEIQSATVEEATSISLSKTPTTPTPFSPTSPRRIDMRRSSEGSRKLPQLTNETPPPSTISHSQKGSMSRFHSDSEILKAGPDQIPQVSFTTAPQPTTETQSPESVTALPRREDSASPVPNREEGERQALKKTGVSSLISQRIKAFESFSSSKPQPNPTKAVVTPAFVSIRKASLNTPPTSAQGEPGRNGSYFSSQTGYPTPSPSPHSFSARLFGKSNPTHLDRKESPTSVSAGIATNVSNSSMDSKSASGDLQGPATTSNKRSSFFGSRSSKTQSSVSSAASLKDGLAPSKTDVSTSRLSFSSRRSSSDTQVPTRSLSPESLASDGEKKESKRKRLFKRLSSIGGAPRRNIAEALSPASTLNNQPILESQEPPPSWKWSTTVTLGDVNVQFPDTLLWKRRHVEIDNHGLLILSQLDKGSKLGSKRYHISDFCTPYIPDPDREELPHSVSLDFTDGSTLQCACESSAGQFHILQVFLEAHQAFTRLS